MLCSFMTQTVYSVPYWNLSENAFYMPAAAAAHTYQL